MALVGSVGLGAILVAALGVFLAGNGAPLPIDRAVLDWVVGHRTPSLTTVAEWVSAVCGYLGMSVVAAIVGVIVAVRDRGRRPSRRYPSTVAPAAAVFGAMAVTEVIKRLVARPRPPNETRLSLAEQSYSYPSGHAAVASACLITVAVVLCHARTGHGRTGWLLTVAAAGGWAVIVAATRVYLGVHWLTDVVAGLMLGSVISVVVIALLGHGRGPVGPRARQR